MSAKVVTGSGTRKGSGPPGTTSGIAPPPKVWSILAWIGFALAAAGSTDVALTWVPADFGNVEWEFGTVTSSFNGLTSVILGLGLWLAAAASTGRRKTVIGLSAAFALLAVLIVAAGVLWATTVPIALGSVPDGAIRGGLQKAIAKTTMQCILYPVAFGVVAWKGFRASPTDATRSP